MEILIKGGRVVDPWNNVDEELDILIEGGVIKKVAPFIKNNKSQKVIDARGYIVAPGFIDMHTHLREPGREDEETLYTASRSAIKGGFTSICAMPNTKPPCDNQGVAGFIIAEAKRIGLCNIYPFGTITRERAGQELSEIGELKKAGVVALSDDGDSVDNTELMRRALEYASMFGLPVVVHCEDKSLSEGGVVNEGDTSAILGLRGIPEISETTRLSRDLELARWVGGRLHIAHLSTKRSVELVKEAKKNNVDVTSETCPHYFALTEEVVKTFDTNTKVNPPLRTKSDTDAIKKGLSDGTIDVISTDHAPHAEDEKDTDYDTAPFGMIGLETAVSLAIMELIESGVLDWTGIVMKFSVNPARILGIPRGNLGVGQIADVIVIDPKREWVVTKDMIYSKSKNTPFLGKRLRGMIVVTIVGGRIVYEIPA